MGKMGKELYVAPGAAVLELRSEGIVCESGGTQDYNRNDSQEW